MNRRRETKRLRKLMYKSSSAHSARECGSCTACCTVMAVKELGKGAMGAVYFARHPRLRIDVAERSLGCSELVHWLTNDLSINA